MVVPKTVGERVVDLRRRRGWTQLDLARELPLSDSYVSLIESGKRRPSRRVLALLAQKLGCPLDYLLAGPEPDPAEAAPPVGPAGEVARPIALELRFAELALRSGDAQVARRGFAAVIARCRTMGVAYRPEALLALWGLCRADEALGDLESAIAGLEELATAPELPPALSRTAVAMTLCRACWQRGDLRRAVDVGESAWRLVDPDATGDARDEAIELGSTLVLCYYERGDLTRAHLLAQNLIETADRGGSTRSRGAAYWNAALVAEGRGELAAARTFAERALALYGETDNLRAIALLRLTNAWVLLKQPQPDHEAARELLRRAYADFLQVGNPVDLASTETELARCELLAGEAAAAAATAASALARLGTRPRIEAARARAVLADARLAAGDVEGAVDAYTRAAEDLDGVGASRHAAAMWREVADGLSALGRSEQAVVAYRRATEALGVFGRPDPDAAAAAAAGIRPGGDGRFLIR